MLLTDLVLGSAMIALTVVIHTLGLVALIAGFKARAGKLIDHHPYVGMIRVLVTTIVAVFLLHTIEIWVWALLYMEIGEFATLSRALYFSTVTYTTLGYGDVVLHDRWQLLSSFEAANGIILFGVSTAFIFTVMRRVFPPSLISPD